ncbi:MAG: DUF1360 domain-containing protein [Pseudolabrys sp.]|nr:DUF1360 domain-containing protein [Pseudolabrys sp.]MBV9954100.1 DUF1360 domain-containing protein [Pseudolabrys sp.]
MNVREEQNFWTFIALALFIAFCAAAAAIIYYRALPALAALGGLDLAVLGLAAFRFVHLLTYDKILEPVRSAFKDRRGNRLKNAGRGWRRLVCEFLDCIWCTGMWSALIVVTSYLLGPIGVLFVWIFAVAGFGSLLQVISKTIASLER